MNRVTTFSLPSRDFSIACVVPVYNEGLHIAEFLRALHRYLQAISRSAEIVVVNDGSVDNSVDEILSVAQECDVHYIELSRNFGKEFAIQAGLDAVRSDCAIIIDADFQHPLDVINEMVVHWRAGADMVYGVRADRSGESVLKKVGSKLLYKALSSQGRISIPADAGDFRLLDRKVIEVLRALPERTRFMKGIYAWGGFKSVAVPFAVGQRPSGKSKYGVVRLAALAVTGITAFSNAPLRCVSVAGFMISALATIVGCWLVVEKIFMNQPIPGFTTVAASVLFLSGVQLLALGIVGEYVGRIFDEVKHRPLYVISRQVDCGVLKHSGAVVNRQQA